MTATLPANRSVGHSPVMIPPVALGCGNFGGVGSAPEFFGQGLDDDQALRLMDAAWEFGITHFDTADAYGGGLSELVIGRWIRSRGVTPLLTTKTFNPMQAGGDRGLQPERIARQLQSSLERLGVAQVDLYLAHEFDPEVPMSESFGVLDAACTSGIIRVYGVSNFSAPQLAASLAAGTPQVIQNNYSLLARQDETELLSLCVQQEVAFQAFSPLAGGWLTGKYRPGQPFPAGSRMAQRPDPYREYVAGHTFEVLDRLEAIASQRGTSLAGLALGWLLADKRVTQIVIGPGRAEHLAPVSEALAHPLTDEELAAIDGAFA